MSIPSTTDSLLAWALWYAEHGHPVFPCHTPTPTGCSCRKPTCDNVGKHPRTQHGLDDATTDPAVITRWWKQWPLANIGLRTGISCWVLDIDARKGGDAELAMLEATHGLLPQTPRALTGGGGAHLVFAMPGQEKIRNGTALLPGLDVRGERGYIVVPPSLHASGKRYLWELTAEIEDTPLVPAPRWLLDLVCNPHQTTGVAPEEPISEGRRNETLSRMAYHMRTGGMSLEEILSAIRGVNARCVPPLDEEELKIIAYGKRDIAPEPVLRTKKQEKIASTSFPEPVSGSTILGTPYPLPLWIVQNLIPEGLTIIGGLPKHAKSYLAYDLALACAGNGLGLNHFAVRRGRALYLAIEDDPSDSQLRMRELRKEAIAADDIFFLHGDDVPTISNGLVEYLRIMVTKYELTMVIIDPLSYIYDPPVRNQMDSFREAKAMLFPLRQLARELHFSLIIVDHRRKQSKEDTDVFQTLYGSIGKYAVADVLMMIVRKDEEVTFHCRGRKIKDQVISTSLRFENGHATWEVLGANDDYGYRTTERKILEAFKEGDRLLNKHVLTLTEILDLAEIEQTKEAREKFRLQLFRMCKANKLIKTERNMYTTLGADDTEGVNL